MLTCTHTYTTTATVTTNQNRSCGYRNLQMLASSLLPDPAFRGALFGGCGFVPQVQTERGVHSDEFTVCRKDRALGTASALGHPNPPNQKNTHPKNNRCSTSSAGSSGRGRRASTSWEPVSSVSPSLFNLTTPSHHYRPRTGSRDTHTTPFSPLNHCNQSSTSKQHLATRTGHRLVGGDDWIGAGEGVALLRSFGIRAFMVQAHLFGVREEERQRRQELKMAAQEQQQQQQVGGSMWVYVCVWCLCGVWGRVGVSDGRAPIFPDFPWDNDSTPKPNNHHSKWQRRPRPPPRPRRQGRWTTATLPRTTRRTQSWRRPSPSP